MSQILAYSPALQSRLKDLLNKNRSLESVSFHELWESLCAALCTLPRVYCIADALDEMDMGREIFMRQLIQLGSQSTVKVLISSRPLPRIENILNDPPSILKIPLRLPLMDHDIATYVQSRLRATDLSQETKTVIQKAIQGKSEGLFLYARLMMDDLFDSGKLQIDRITKALSKLPTGLGELYTTMLNDHSIRSGVPQELQFLILQCVTHSSRPLRLLEIASTHRALAVICIDYLSCGWFNDWEISNNGQPNSWAGPIRMKYPFLDYAINNFHYHISENERNDEEISLKLDILMEPKSKQFLSCIDLMSEDEKRRSGSALIAGIESKFRAILLKLGYMACCSGASH
jgi:hypothetical protein